MVVNDGAVHDVAVVSSNGAIDLYCDGANVAHTDGVNSKISAAQTILLAYDSDSNSYLQMNLYELRCWSVARSSTEIATDISGNENGLEGWYLPSADGLQDYSGNSRHATLYGSPAYIDWSQLKDYLKVWLPFDNSATEDLCGNEWTAYGTPTISDTNAINGKALQLDGSSYLRRVEPFVFAGQAFTVQCWFSGTSNTTGGSVCIWEIYKTSTNRIFLGILKTGKLELWNENTRSDVSTSTSVLDGQKHFAETNFDGTTWRLFLDGNLVGSMLYTPNATNYTLSLGNNTYSGRKFTGTIDEFQIYDGVTLHTENFTPPTMQDYYDLALKMEASLLIVDVERRIKNVVEFTADVERVVRSKWQYINLGTANTLIIAGTTLTNLPATQSKTGTAFYQTTRAKCFDIPATDEIWLKFDVYFDGSNRWRAYNGVSNVTTGITAQTSGELSFFSNGNNNQGNFSGVCITNQLQTVLLHMMSGSSDGIIEAWVDGDFIYRYTGDVNHGEDFADIYLQSDGSGTFFSNVIISNHEIGLEESIQLFSADVERQVKWRYVNPGNIELLSGTGAVLTVDATKSTTGTAVYGGDTKTNICNAPAGLKEIWMSFDLYIDDAVTEGDLLSFGYYSSTFDEYVGIYNHEDYPLQPIMEIAPYFVGINSEWLYDEFSAGKLNHIWIHMKSDATAGTFEIYINGKPSVLMQGNLNLNNGDGLGCLYFYSNSPNILYSNIHVSSEEIVLRERVVEFITDIERKVTQPIIVPLIGEHFNHFVQSVTVCRDVPKKIILPKKSAIFIRAVGAGTVKIFSDTDTVGQITGTILFEQSDMYAELSECEKAFIKLESTVAPTNVIQKLVKYLVETNGGKSDDAINYATNGKICSKIDLANKIYDDADNAKSYTEFLEEKCGIILGNADTGAITGSDAGGNITKTAADIVPEETSPVNWIVPEEGSTVTINGLNVIFPSNGASGSGFTAAEKHIMAGLNSVWIKQSLKLIKETLGIGFDSDTAFIHDVKVKFEDNAESYALAYIQPTYVQNVTTSLNEKYLTDMHLIINMHYYSDVDPTSEDGLLISSSTMYNSAGYLDRTLAHELTHAVMLANIDKHYLLAEPLQEGLAEIVHGIDDLRGGSIVSLVSTRSGRSDLQQQIQWGANYTVSEKTYAAGYIALRYLSKQIEDIEPAPAEREIVNLFISDGGTGQEISLDVLRTLIKSTPANFDVEILDTIPIEFIDDVSRAILAKLKLFPLDNSIFLGGGD